MCDCPCDIILLELRNSYVTLTVTYVFILIMSVTIRYVFQICTFYFRGIIWNKVYTTGGKKKKVVFSTLKYCSSHNSVFPAEYFHP